MLFVIGVPRSGTTLLRAMLDSHPELMCGPENPWLSHHPELPNLQNLVGHLSREPAGAVACHEGVNREQVDRLTAIFYRELMNAAAEAQGKTRWADKTPKNMLSVPFLRRLFPEARFLHLLRDGRDVALSTKACRWEKLQLNNEYLPNTYANALKRWVSWLGRLEEAHCPESHILTIRYEELVTQPREVMTRVLDFAQLEWSDQVLSPYDYEHEAGPKQREGLSSYEAHERINDSSVGRWRNLLTAAEQQETLEIAGVTLESHGYELNQ